MGGINNGWQLLINMYSFIDSNYFYLFMFVVSFVIIWWSGV